MKAQAMTAALSLLLFLPASLKAQSAKGVMEGVRTSDNTILISTRTKRVLVSTTVYNGGIQNVGLYTSSNVVISDQSSNKCVIYATGSISCIGTVSGSADASNPWTRTSTNIVTTNAGDYLLLGAGGTAIQIISTGTYSPSFTCVTSCTSVTTVPTWNFMRIGNRVFVDGYISQFDPAAVTTLTRFEVSLPIASDFVTSFKDGSGTFSCYFIDGGFSIAVVVDTSDDRMAFISSPTTGNAVECSGKFSYTVN